MSASHHMPTHINQHSSTEILIVWSTGERFALPFFEMRFHCPCAGCVDEHTGQRTIQKAAIKPDIRPKSAQMVGRYAIHMEWGDGHTTGMYEFDLLHNLCLQFGKKV